MAARRSSFSGLRYGHVEAVGMQILLGILFDRGAHRLNYGILDSRPSHTEPLDMFGATARLQRGWGKVDKASLKPDWKSFVTS